MASVSILKPLDVAEWDDLLLACDCATFFHTAAWAHVLSGSYGYTPLYFTIIENGRLTGLIPAMEIDSFLTGKRGVSLPFTDFCLPIAADSESFIALQDAVRAYGRKACWKSIEFRGGENFGHEPAWKSYFTHTLAVDQDENAIFKAFRGNTRRNIRHAIGAGVSVQRLESREAVAEFFRLHCITRRNHGLPPQPARFFDQIYDHIIAAGRGFVMLAWHQCRVVAGAMFFHFKDHAIYKFGASDRNCQRLRANNMVMWESIRWCCQNGIRSFLFGRTEPGNKGLLQFKRAWGTNEDRLEYCKFDFRAEAFITEKSRARTFYPFFRIMPMPLLRLAGNLLYRHLG